MSDGKLRSAARKHWMEVIGNDEPKYCANGSYEYFEQGYFAGHLAMKERAERAEAEVAGLKCPPDDDGERHPCTVCGRGVLYGERHHQCGSAVLAFEKERDELKADLAKARKENEELMRMDYWQERYEAEKQARVKAEEELLKLEK